MRPLRRTLGAGRAHQPQAWSRFGLLCGLLVLLCALLMVDWASFGNWERWSSFRAPEAVSGPPLPEKAAFLSIDRHGIVRISPGEETSLPVSSEDELLAAVRNIVVRFPWRPFVLKIDTDTPYGQVENLLVLLRKAGAKSVYFYTELPSR